ncbi:unnamed protein product, partial [Effrenium voratum]
AAGRLLPEVLRGGQAVGQALPSRGRRLPLRRGRPRRASALHGPRGVPKAQQAHPGGAERPADGRRGRRAGGSKGPRRPAPLCRFLASPLVTRASREMATAQVGLARAWPRKSRVLACVSPDPGKRLEPDTALATCFLRPSGNQRIE